MTGRRGCAKLKIAGAGCARRKRHGQRREPPSRVSKASSLADCHRPFARGHKSTNAARTGAALAGFAGQRNVSSGNGLAKLSQREAQDKSGQAFGEAQAQ